MPIQNTWSASYADQSNHCQVSSMRTEDIIEFVKKHVEPLPAYPPYGERYRVAATMTDGTYLPCVVIENASHTIDLALKRFEETRKSSDLYMGYRAIVTLFVTEGNTVNEDDLKDLALCSFAIPPPRMQEIKGETSMGWTEFYALMKDEPNFASAQPTSQSSLTCLPAIPLPTS